MKISIIGTRGIPANYGGFETFAEELSINITKLDPTVKITVIADCDQQQKNHNLASYHNVHIKYSKYYKDKNPLMFYFDSIMKSLNDDIILSCGNGGGFFSWIPKFSRAKYLTNPDGLEWKRSKWSFSKRMLIKTLEWFSVKFSDYLICDSEGITEYINNTYRYGKKLYTIEYGAYINEFIALNNEKTQKILDKYPIKPHAYHLVVSRLEPENNVDIIIEGYKKSKAKYPLVIIGNLLNNSYVQQLQELASENVIFIGGVYNKEELSIIRANAFSYFHGHSVGGTNPSLLEAMGSNNLCICHDNAFNRKTTQDHGYYFSEPADVSEIVNFIENPENADECAAKQSALQTLISEYYNWNDISKRYYLAFKEILAEKAVGI